VSTGSSADGQFHSHFQVGNPWLKYSRGIQQIQSWIITDLESTSHLKIHIADVQMLFHFPTVATLMRCMSFFVCPGNAATPTPLLLFRYCMRIAFIKDDFPTLGKPATIICRSTSPILLYRRHVLTISAQAGTICGTKVIGK